MLNILKMMAMIGGALVGQEVAQDVVTGSEWVRPDSGGFLTFHQPIGAKVSAGDRRFTVWDPFGEIRHEVAAPFGSIILDVRLRASALPGEWAYHCGRLEG